MRSAGEKIPDQFAPAFKALKGCTGITFFADYGTGIADKQVEEGAFDDSIQNESLIDYIRFGILVTIFLDVEYG